MPSGSIADLRVRPLIAKVCAYRTSGMKTPPPRCEIIESLSLLYPSDEEAFAADWRHATEVSIPSELTDSKILPIIADGAFYWAVPKGTSNDDLKWMKWLIARYHPKALEPTFVLISKPRFITLHRQLTA